jgi:hypothetical protein
MRHNRLQIGVAIGLIALCVYLRVLPHPANFAPVAAVAIFGGAVLPRKVALWVPLLAMMVSDAIIGFYSMMFVTWACYLIIALASSSWLRKPTLLKTATLTLSSSVFFFVATNFAVWLTSGMYSHTLAGLGQCYTLALPFFRNTVASDLVYTAALFGVFGLVNVAVRNQSVHRNRRIPEAL